MAYSKIIQIKTAGQALYEITNEVESIVNVSKAESGLCTVFIQHTSASLIIQENADPSARRDLEKWLGRLVKEDDPIYTHTSEGPDDMPSHIKAILTSTSLSIPILGGCMVLGTWQGIYLWEHRRAPHNRNIVVSVLS